MVVRPRAASRSSGLDVSLLGAIAAGVGYYAGGFSGATRPMPRLIRFAETGPGYEPVAAMPQDSALLLLLQSGSSATPTPAPGASPWSLLVVLGLVLVVAGPVWGWLGRDAD